MQTYPHLDRPLHFWGGLRLGVSFPTLKKDTNYRQPTHEWTLSGNPHPSLMSQLGVQVGHRLGRADAVDLLEPPPPDLTEGTRKLAIIFDSAPLSIRWTSMMLCTGISSVPIMIVLVNDSLIMMLILISLTLLDSHSFACSNDSTTKMRIPVTYVTSTKNSQLLSILGGEGLCLSRSCQAFGVVLTRKASPISSFGFPFKNNR